MTSRLPGLFPSSTLAGAPRILRHKAFQRSWQRRHPDQSPLAGRRTFTSQQEQGAHRSKYDVTGTTVVLTLIPIVTFALGTWQIKRLQWKLNLINELDEKLAREPLQLPNMVDTSVIPEFAYRKVELSGHFDHSREILLGPRTRDGVLGYQVVTPFIREEGGQSSTVLVNRGHVSLTKKDQASRPESLVEGTQHIVGMLRSQESRNMFTPANKPESREFQFADIDQMASLTHSQPVLIDEIFEGNAGEMKQMVNHGIPLGRAPTIELRNMHATYAVTWYALSAATSVMLWRLFRRPPARTSKFTRFES
ncbi:SURF1-domain-containing protein [Cystobasidium minutum MCA 4210]|uniref:SURF1-domain-containing protein n=1 Tax=Cystobasidium minutum MCA 4210 TaxID=1397322 RepID=UPI0034CF7709|eukprot:jgi/Rhomi1/55613/CE55612_5494